MGPKGSGGRRRKVPRGSSRQRLGNSSCKIPPEARKLHTVPLSPRAETLLLCGYSLPPSEPCRPSRIPASCGGEDVFWGWGAAIARRLRRTVPHNRNMQTECARRKGLRRQPNRKKLPRRGLRRQRLPSEPSKARRRANANYFFDIAPSTVRIDRPDSRQRLPHLPIRRQRLPHLPDVLFCERRASGSGFFCYTGCYSIQHLSAHRGPCMQGSFLHVLQHHLCKYPVSSGPYCRLQPNVEHVLVQGSPGGPRTPGERGVPLDGQPPVLDGLSFVLLRQRGLALGSPRT